jgi:two-component system CheB/CheR fusion protein
MKNLLDSTNIATLFLDDTLHVRRFTSQTSKIIRLLPGDAGRPITDITSDLLYPDLVEDCREVLRTLVFRERTVTTQNEDWFSVRIMPYRTLDNRIDGVVITFADISTAKKLENTLRKNERDMKALMDFLPQPFGVFETVWEEAGRLIDCRILYMNNAFAQVLGLISPPRSGQNLTTLWHDIGQEWLTACEQVAKSGKPAVFQMQATLVGLTFNCTLYRPGDTKSQICMIMER